MYIYMYVLIIPTTLVCILISTTTIMNIELIAKGKVWMHPHFNLPFVINFILEQK